MKYSKSFTVFGFEFEVSCERPAQYHVYLFNKATSSIVLYHYQLLFSAIACAKRVAKLAALEWDQDVTVKVLDNEGELAWSITALSRRRIRLISNRGRRA